MACAASPERTLRGHGRLVVSAALAATAVALVPAAARSAPACTVRLPQGSDLGDGDIAILGLVLTTRGTEAWIARDCARSAADPATCAQPVTPEYRVTIPDATTGTGQFGERVVSRSAAIAPHSLALAANRHAIYWTEAGAARTAPIR